MRSSYILCKLMNKEKRKFNDLFTVSIRFDLSDGHHPWMLQIHYPNIWWLIDVPISYSNVMRHKSKNECVLMEQYLFHRFTYYLYDFSRNFSVSKYQSTHCVMCFWRTIEMNHLILQCAANSASFYVNGALSIFALKVQNKSKHYANIWEQ